MDDKTKEIILSLLNHPENTYTSLPKWKDYIYLEESKWTYTLTGNEDFYMKHLKPKHLIKRLIELLDLKEEII